MPDRPDELRILVPESERARVQRLVTRRHALLAGGGAAMAAYLAGCGGKSSSSGSDDGGGASAEAPPTAADAEIEKGDLLLANWADYSDPVNYKGFAKEFGSTPKVSGYGSNEELLAKLRAGGSKFDIVAPTGYAVKTMIDQDLALPLTQDLIPNIKNLSPAFRETEYDPGNKYSVAKDYGVTSFYWLTDKVSAQPTTIKEAFDLLKSPELKDVRVNVLEGSTQLIGMALKALGYSLNSEEQSEIDEAKQLLIDVKPNIDTISSTYIDKATNGEIEFGLGWNGDVRRAIVALEEKGKEMVFMVPEDSTEYWVDNWVIPAAAEHPVAAHAWINYVLDPANAGREFNYHQFSVPVEGMTGVDEKLAADPVVNIPDEKLQMYETQLETPNGAKQRNRAYTEFKAA